MSEKKFVQFNKICTQEKGMLSQNKGVIVWGVVRKK